MEKSIRVLLLFFVLLCFQIRSLKSQSLIKEGQKPAYEQVTGMIRTAIQLAAKDQLDSSATCLMNAKVIADINKFEDLSAMLVVELSRIEFYRKEYQKALNIILDIKPYYELHPDQAYAGDVYGYIGNYYTHLNRYDEALREYKKAEAWRSAKEPFKNWRTYLSLSNMYTRMNKADSATYFMNKAEKLVKIQSTNRILKDMENNLLLGHKNETIDELNTENKQTKIELQKTKWRNRLAFSGLLILLLVSGLLYTILKQRNRINKEISQKNLLITKNLEEKDFLIKEIHHRVKNNLQVVSSLLSLQSRTINDEKAAQALHEGQARVLSMALIHQNLYKDTVASEVDMNNYIRSLVQQLFNTYNISQEKIQLHLDIDPIKLDVSTLVPLGLIINELITNAMKYAFAKNEAGNIWLKLKDNSNFLLLEVKDDGIGYNTNDAQFGFGTKLIETFSKKLEADWQQINENGTTHILKIKNFKLMA